MFCCCRPAKEPQYPNTQYLSIPSGHFKITVALSTKLSNTDASVEVLLDDGADVADLKMRLHQILDCEIQRLEIYIKEAVYSSSKTLLSDDYIIKSTDYLSASLSADYVGSSKD